MKLSTAAALSLALALSACGPGPNGKESGLVTALRAVFAFKTCASKLEDRFNLNTAKGVSIQVGDKDMDPISTGKPGEWDVKFTASVTETQTGRVTRYQGVCHVRRDRPTTLEASSLGVVKPAETPGEVRRTAS